jgi:hypothetical protein
MYRFRVMDKTSLKPVAITQCRFDPGPARTVFVFLDAVMNVLWKHLAGEAFGGTLAALRLPALAWGYPFSPAV